MGTDGAVFDGLPRTDATAALRARHAAFFLDLARSAEPHLRRADQVHWLDVLDANWGNLRSAIEWALEHGDVEEVLTATTALRWFWSIRGRWPQGQRLLERAIDAAGSSRVLAAARAHTAAAELAGLGAGPRRDEHIAVAASILEEAPDRRATLELDFVRTMHDVTPGAVDALRRSIAVARVAGDPILLADLLSRLGTALAMRGEPAGEVNKEALALYRQEGDRFGAGWVLELLAWRIGRKADDAATEGLRLAHELGDVSMIATFADTVCWQAVAKGDYEAAVSVLQEALARCGPGADPTITTWLHADLAIAATEHGRYDMARSALEDFGRAAGEATWAWTPGKANALVLGAEIEQMDGDPVRARGMAEEAVALTRPVGGRALRFTAERLGNVLFAQGDLDGARRLYVDVLDEPLAQRHGGDAARDWMVLLHLVELELEAGDVDAAAAWFERLASESPARDNSWVWHRDLLEARVRAAAGERDAAGEALARSLRAGLEHEQRWLLTLAMLEGAALACADGDAGRAARLAGAHDGLRAAIGRPVWYIMRRRYERIVAEVGAAAGDEIFEVEYDRGRRMGFDEAVAFALG